MNQNGAKAVSGGTGTQSTPANNVGGERRSSNSGGGGLFSGLTNQKRSGSDAAQSARRESFADQKPAAGVIGQMWNNFTTGSGKQQ